MKLTTTQLLKGTSNPHRGLMRKFREGKWAFKKGLFAGIQIADIQATQFNLERLEEWYAQAADYNYSDEQIQSVFNRIEEMRDEVTKLQKLGVESGSLNKASLLAEFRRMKSAK